MPSEEFRQGLTLMWDMRRERQLGPPATIAGQRTDLDGIAAMFPLPDDVSVTPVVAGTTRCEWVTSPGVAEDRVVLYLHGGAYVAGSPTSHRELAARIGRAAGARALVADYRLAPEHPHPAAVVDALAVYRWLLMSEGLPAGSLAVAGDSAGGGLTIAALVALRDDAVELPTAAAVLSPWVDLEGTGASARSRADEDPVLDGARLAEMAACYANGLDLRTPLISPLYADLAGLPPLLIQVGTAEVLLDDATRLAAAAREAGVDVTLEVAEEMVHVWQVLSSVPEAGEATTRIGAFLAEHWR